MANSHSDERQILKTALGAGGQCPDLEHLAAFHDGSLAGAEAAGTRQHVEACARCRTELALMAEFESAQPDAAEAADVAWIAGQIDPPFRTPTPAAVHQPGWRERLAAWWTPAPRGLAWGAALAVAVAAGLYVQHGGAPGRPVYDGGAEVLRSSRVAVVAPIGAAEVLPVEFRWKEVAGAATYRVRVLTVDGTELWSVQSSTTFAAVPNGLLAQGRAYRWEVTASNAAGATLATSDLQNFHIAVTSR